MLHKNTVEKKTFELLTRLMLDENLKRFNLAGGTALALYLGHRISVDLDLFTPNDFDAEKLESYLINNYDFKSDFLEKNTLKGTINNIKIDCITHAYPYYKEIIISQEGIRLYSMEDIAAMKLSAITDNGTRLKDFIDVACLSTKFSFSDMLNAYKNKFKNINPIGPIRALTYYDDVNFNEPIQIINGQYKWELIKKRLQDMINLQNRIFEDYPFIGHNLSTDKSIEKTWLYGQKDRLFIKTIINGEERMGKLLKPADVRDYEIQKIDLEYLRNKYFKDELKNSTDIKQTNGFKR